MGISKVNYSGNTLIDLTNDTVSPDNLLLGATAHDKSGNLITGEMEQDGYSITSTDNGDGTQTWVVSGNSAGVDTLLDDFKNLIEGKSTSIAIPEGTTKIRDYAFNYCSSLTNITIPEGVTSIGGYAFQGCSSLTEVTIPNSVRSIDSGTFSGCSSLTDVIIPNKIISIGDLVFSSCAALQRVVITRADNVPLLANSNAFPGTGFAPNLKIYVPDSLVDKERIFPQLRICL